MGALPGPDTVWTAEGNGKLTPETPVTLTFTNEKGLVFKRTISVDNEYLFTVADSVTNGGAADASLLPYGRVIRYQKPTGTSVYVLHEGAIGYDDVSGLTEAKFAKLEEDKEIKPEKGTAGWLGFTDKYWAAALIPSNKSGYQPRYSYFADGRTRYQADYLSDAVSIKPGQTQTVETRFFAGAKEVGIINAYRENSSIPRFDLMIDWGWFYFLTKPMFSSWIGSTSCLAILASR